MRDYLGDWLTAFIGSPIVFLYYAFFLVTAIVVARISQLRDLRFAVSVITLSWILTKAWWATFSQPTIGNYAATIGFFVIDFTVMMSFATHAWKRKSIELVVLTFLFFIFLVLHGVGAQIDLSSENFLGGPKSDSWMQAFWRNRIFEVVLLWVIFWGGSIYAFKHWSWARKIALYILNNLPLIGALPKVRAVREHYGKGYLS